MWWWMWMRCRWFEEELRASSFELRASSFELKLKNTQVFRNLKTFSEDTSVGFDGQS
jgi:hypothetical protein